MCSKTHFQGTNSPSKDAHGETTAEQTLFLENGVGRKKERKEKEERGKSCAVHAAYP